jgi:hypothetical protein
LFYFFSNFNFSDKIWVLFEISFLTFSDQISIRCFPSNFFRTFLYDAFNPISSPDFRNVLHFPFFRRCQFDFFLQVVPFQLPNLREIIDMYYDHMLADAGTTSLEVWEGEILDQVRFLILYHLTIIL